MEDQLQKNNKYHFILMYIISYVAFSFCMTNFTPYLSSIGYDAMMRGIMLSGYALTTIVFQLLFGFLSDKFQSVKKIVITALLLFGLASVLLFQGGTRLFFIQLVLIAMSGGLVNGLCGLYDTWILGTHADLKQSLSFIKAFGSVGWAIGSVLASFLIVKLTYRGLGIAVAMLVVLSLCNMMRLPDIEQYEAANKVKLKDILTLFQIPRYSLLILILFLMYAMVIANSCTVVDKMLSLHASNFEISLKWAMGSLLEIPTYVMGSYLLRKVSAVHLLQFSSVMLSIQFTLFALASSSELMILCNLLQVFSTPLILITSKVLIYEISPCHMRNSSQLIALSLFMGVSSFIVPSIAGYLSERIGYTYTLGCVAMLGVLAFSLILILKRTYVQVH